MLVSDLPDDALNVFITLNARGLNGSFIIVALCRQNGTLIKNPQSGTILEVGDRVIVMGHQGDKLIYI